MKNSRTVAALALLLPGFGIGPARVPGQERLIHVPLAYRAPGNGPAPNFSPKGTQVPLLAMPPGSVLPAGAMHPAKSGAIKVGPDQRSWIPVLATADAGHPQDLCRLYLDRNRNGNFGDDGPAIAAVLTQNPKTKAWWSSFNNVELSIPYGEGKGVEPYMVNFWIVREGDAAPEILRYSVGSWRFGTVTVNGIDALVAAMDADNDAVFGAGDNWSVLAAAAPDAEKTVLSHTEARPTNRLMFLPDGSGELVLEFRSFSPDGRSIDFAVVDRPATKAADRAGDDVVAAERARPRAMAPFSWSHDFNPALAQAKTGGRKVLVDFEATWCGPCRNMDEWIWTDAEVTALLTAGYIGIKIDGDIEKGLVKRFEVSGYPTIVVLDSSGKEADRATGYLSSKEVIALLNAKR